MKLLYSVCLMMLSAWSAFAQGEVDNQEAESSAAATANEVKEAPIDLIKATMSDPDVVSAQEEQKAEELPDSFVVNLLQCSPDSINRTIGDASENLRIIAPNDNKCQIKLDIFMLNIPNEMLPRLKTFENFESLIQDPKIAALNFQDNYRFSGLATELLKCKDYQQLNHKGRNSVEYKYAGVTAISDMTAQHKGNGCELTFVNELSINGSFININVICLVSDEKIEELTAPYSDTVKTYNEDSENAAKSGITDEYMYRIDAKLMYELQMNGYCQMAEEH